MDAMITDFPFTFLEKFPHEYFQATWCELINWNYCKKLVVIYDLCPILLSRKFLVIIQSILVTNHFFFFSCLPQLWLNHF